MNLRKEEKLSLKNITINSISSGQKGAYKDTINSYQVISTYGYKKTKDILLREFLYTENQSDNRSNFYGSCGYPFGTEPFYGLFVTQNVDEFKLLVCYPYCD